MAVQLLNRIFLLVVGVLMILPAMANDNRYNIGPGDALAISVFGEPELAVRAQVAQSGRIQFPLIGHIMVLDKTPEQIAAELETALLDGYLVNPTVTVTVEAYRPIFIKGAVSRAGRHDFLFNLDVEQAIAIAGGLTDRASDSQWFIVRRGEKFKASAKTQVIPGDVVIIEESLF